jgi:hypothetical protein
VRDIVIGLVAIAAGVAQIATRDTWGRGSIDRFNRAIGRQRAAPWEYRLGVVSTVTTGVAFVIFGIWFLVVGAN